MSSNPRGVKVLGATVTLGVIDTVAVMLRLLARRKTCAGLGADDWLIMASLLPAYAMIICCGLC